MKSFRHFYHYVILDSLDGSNGGLTIRGRAPREVPDKIARWLLQRKFYRDHFRPLLDRMKNDTGPGQKLRV